MVVFRVACSANLHLSLSLSFSVFLPTNQPTNQPIKNKVLAATINLAAQDERQLRLCFSRLDCDGSGEISLENLKAMVGKDVSEAELAEMLQEVDIKKTGVIDYEEFSAAMSIARRRHASASSSGSSQ